MKEKELYDLLKDQQDILVHINQRLDHIDKAGVEQNSYSEQLDSIIKITARLGSDYSLIDLREHISRHTASNSNLFNVISDQYEMHDKLLKEIPTKMKVSVQHNLTGKQRYYVLFGISLVVFAFLSVCSNILLWRDSNRLIDSDVKIRMVRLLYPSVWIDVDSVYIHSPERIKRWIEHEEEKLIAIKKAEELAKKANEKASRAKTHLRRLKEQGNKNSK